MAARIFSSYVALILAGVCISHASGQDRSTAVPQSTETADELLTDRTGEVVDGDLDVLRTLHFTRGSLKFTGHTKSYFAEMAGDLAVRIKGDPHVRLLIVGDAASDEEPALAQKRAAAAMVRFAALCRARHRHRAAAARGSKP
jgi:hypothetical protein